MPYQSFHSYLEWFNRTTYFSFFQKNNIAEFASFY